MTVGLQLISGVPELEAIRKEWAALVERCPGATVFQRPEWLIPWWRYSSSGQMWTLAFRAGERLVAMAPMFVHEWDNRRQVTLLGTGVSDHLDLLADAEFAAGCAAATLQFLYAHNLEWDLCDLQDLPAGSHLLSALRAEPGSEVSESAPCAEVELPRSEEDFNEGLPHGLRRNIRRYGDRLRDEYDTRFETTGNDESGELTEALFRLHGERWRTKGETGMLAGREPFFKSVTPALAQTNLIRFHSLRIEGSIAGIIYQLRDSRRAYGYITGFDPAFDRYSPGVLLLHHAMRHAIQEGASTWDFLRGSERYKFKWGARQRCKFRLRLWPPSI